MTVTYTAEVASCRGFGCFLKLLFRWRGSIYKLVWLDLLVFLFVYYVLNIIYRFALNEYQKEIFEEIVQYCYNYSDLIPLSFVLGFYVSIVMTRWWNQYVSIPWPDPIAVFVSSNIHGQDERGRVMRRTVMRYVCLCLTMVLTNISPRVKKRFPSLNNFVEAGLLTDNEKDIIDIMNKGFPRHSKHWLPIVWAASIVTRARKEGRIRDDFAVKTILDELNKFRGKCGLLISYDTISVPLVYTQVVTLAVYSYFVCSVMGQQWTEGKVVNNSTYINKIDLYFPVFTTLQFFFYMGWLKVAESLINPFGEDDDDFEVNWMVDRNLQVSYLIVDEMHHEHPELIKDQYWDEVFPNELPYTIATERFREEHPEPSTARIEVPKAAAMSSVMSAVRIDDMVGNNNPPNSSVASVQTVNYKFPANVQEEEPDDTSGIHFTADHIKTPHPGSINSIVSLSGTLSRVATAASALKRLISREDSRQDTLNLADETQKHRFSPSVSTTSLARNSIGKGIGSVRITDQVIEEVDEQTTVTSQRVNDSIRPKLEDIFPQTLLDKNKHSIVAVDASSGKTIYTRTQSNVEPNLFPPGGVEALLSTSAPVESSPLSGYSAMSSPVENKFAQPSYLGEKQDNLQSNENLENSNGQIAAGIDETDDFEKLKAEREKERLERQNQIFARSISSVSKTENIVTPIQTTPALVPTNNEPLTPTSVMPNAKIQQ